MSGLCHSMLRSTAWGWWGRGISAYNMLLWVSVQLLLSWKGKHKQLPKVCKLCMTGQKLEPGFELGTSAFKRYWIIRTAAEWPFLFVFSNSSVTYQQVSTTFCLLAGWNVSSPGICSRDFCHLDSGKLKRLCLSGDLHLWTPPVFNRDSPHWKL